MKIAKKNTEPIIAKTRSDHTVITENLEEHETLLSSIFLFGELVEHEFRSLRCLFSHTDILSRTVAELSQLIVQILDTAFFSSPWEALWQRKMFILGSLESA